MANNFGGLINSRPEAEGEIIRLPKSLGVELRGVDPRYIMLDRVRIVDGAVNMLSRTPSVRVALNSVSDSAKVVAQTATKIIPETFNWHKPATDSKFDKDGSAKEQVASTPVTTSTQPTTVTITTKSQDPSATSAVDDRLAIARARIDKTAIPSDRMMEDYVGGDVKTSILGA